MEKTATSVGGEVAKVASVVTWPLELFTVQLVRRVLQMKKWEYDESRT
jgi:hypothetical protein